ncbi:hypothetical protein D9619_010424 [Psilocybe cf. subviscida]|uniref:hydroxymethylglutaryl-CoA lyase n=1 Tax=Psilocybe cf. subviscida TaxID=2480587 RepID=A0A8H5ASC2_9AGAR|nr:hypothetical protein D9619_010424 [Psilocybe cf. subviscida]
MALARNLPKIPTKLLSKPTVTIARRRYSTPIHGGHTFSTPDPKNIVNLVEVGPRDGLQNEKGAIIPVSLKVELINRLARAGHLNVEAGSFVSPKWVPQMAGTAEVLKGIEKQPGVHYAVLVPNQRGLDHLVELLDANPSNPPLTDEVSVFVAATDAFSRANTNCTVAESLERTAVVTRNALDRGLRVRGYVSVVIRCPFSGEVDAKRVREVTKELYDMGCYEVSLGDTVGLGRPHEVAALLEEVKKGVPVEKLAGHFHDTSGTAIANIMTALEHGVRTFDSSVGGLGGCPYSPGATGNVATEDVLYALQGSKYHVAGLVDVPGRAKTVDLERIVDIGWWISEQLGRENISRTGRMVKARREREEERKRPKSKL